MKSFIRIMLAMLVFAVPLFGGAANNGNCKLFGSWVGYDQYGSAWWMTTADGQNASKGTLNLEAPGSVAYFPDATAVTELKGVWKKTGGNTYEWTVLGFPYNDVGTTLALTKLSGKDALSKDCNTLFVTDVVLEVFAPDADVNTDDPSWTAVFPDHEGHRIQLNLP